MNRPHSYRVLLVEDTASDAWLVEEGFRLLPSTAQITWARDGVEATEYLTRADEGVVAWPHLILLDLNLPRKNGFEVLAEVKASPSWRGIPVVVLSSSDAEDDMRRAYSLNASGFLTKPNSLEAYLELVCDLEKFWLKGAQLRRTA